jgi:hypothetical protein
VECPLSVTTSVGQWLRAVETEAYGTTTETRRDLCLWHASEAVHDTSIRGDRLVATERPAQKLVEAKRMIKIRYPLFGDVLDCNFVDLQRRVGPDTVEEPRGGAGGSDAARMAPSASRSRQTV